MTEPTDELEWVKNVPIFSLPEYRLIRAILRRGPGHRGMLALWNDRRWISQCVQGAPQGTIFYTSQQLQEMHMVGLYRRKTNKE